MKKILLLLFLFCGVVSAQTYHFNGHVDVPKTTTEINAIVSPAEGETHVNSTTGTIWLYINGAWEDTGQSASSDLDLTGNVLSLTNPLTPGNDVDLSTVPIIASALQPTDNVSELTNDSGYITTADVGGIVASGSIEIGEENAGVLFTVTHSLGYAPDASRISIIYFNDVGVTTMQSYPTITSITSTQFSFTLGNTLGYGSDLFAYWAIFGSDNATPMTGSEIVSSIDTELGSTDWQGGGSSPPFPDNAPIIEDDADPTKTITIDASNITTGTNRTLTMPDGDVDLGNLTASNLGTGSVGTSELQDNAVTGVKISNGSITNADIADATIIGSKIANNAILSTKIANNTINEENLNTTNAPTDDYILSYNLAGTNFTWVDPSTIGIQGTISGRTGTAIDAMQTETQAQFDSNGAVSAGEVVLITDASPAEVVTTATIAMEGWKMYDDQTADAATITLSDCEPGETLTVYINRASAPTLAGTGLTFNQLPNTTAFASATEMMIIFEVAFDGTTIDYYYVER